jgi:hypothetical protein
MFSKIDPDIKKLQIQLLEIKIENQKLLAKQIRQLLKLDGED